MTARQDKTREALRYGWAKQMTLEHRAAALAEVEEWEALVARGDTYRAMLSQTNARAEAAEAERDRLKAALTVIADPHGPAERGTYPSAVALAALGEE